MFDLVHSFLSLFLLLSCLVIFNSNNPVYSVLFLILSFLFASIILILFEAEFLSTMFILIYVGAIAVLFIFIVMMINIKNFATIAASFWFLPFLFILVLLLLFESNAFLKKVFFSLDLSEDCTINSLDLIFLKNSSYFFDDWPNILIFGQYFFNYFLYCFLLVGLILLLALLGAIVLTLNFNSLQKKEYNFKQLSRSDNFLSYFF